MVKYLGNMYCIVKYSEGNQNERIVKLDIHMNINCCFYIGE